MHLLRRGGAARPAAAGGARSPGLLLALLLLLLLLLPPLPRPARAIRVNIHGNLLEFPVILKNWTLPRTAPFEAVAHARAAELDLALPRTYSVAVCPGMRFAAEGPSCGHPFNATDLLFGPPGTDTVVTAATVDEAIALARAAAARGPDWEAHRARMVEALAERGDITGFNGTRVIDRDLVLAMEPFAHAFQHDLINGLPSAGMLADWVLADPARRGFLCRPLVCHLLLAVPGVTKAQLFPHRWAGQVIRAPSLRVAFNDWRQEGLTWDSYPAGSFFPAAHYAARYLETAPEGGQALPALARALGAPASPAPLTPLLLYVSRGRAGSRRFVGNEDELVEELRAWAAARGLGFELLHHGGIRGHPYHLRMFHMAWFVVGMHGGALANVVYCSPNATVVEINSCDVIIRRDCFATMALACGLRYSRVCPSAGFSYGSDSRSVGINLTRADIGAVLGALNRPGAEGAAKDA